MKIGVFFSLLAVLLTGPRGAQARDIVWPAAPDIARIKYLTSLPEMVQAEPDRESFLGKSIRFVFGAARQDARERRKTVLFRPTGVWSVGDAIYVADRGRRRVVRYDLDTGRATSIPKSGHRLVSPVGVAVSRGGKIFVSDAVKRQVLIFNPRGGYEGRLNPPPADWGRPTGLALDEKAGRLYVADTPAHVIHVYDLSEKHIRSFGGAGQGPGEFNHPTYLCVDQRQGRLMVCDSMNCRVQILDRDGRHIRDLGKRGDRPGYLARPRGVSVDSDGNVYVVDGAMENVQIFGEEGELLLFFGTSGNWPGSFSLPGGIFIDNADRVFVADTYNARLQMFQYLGESGA